METIRIATRGSMLARRQTELVAEGIRAAHPNVRIEPVCIRTKADSLRGPLASAGGKGLFTTELEQALRQGRVELAVHSAKDVPAQMGDDLTIAAVPVRADSRDALLSRDGANVEGLRRNATVGTGSGRRKAQLLAARPDLAIVPIRGNVETRVDKVLDAQSDELDATVLAMAGLIRIGLADEYAGHIAALEVEQFVPAAGQGALAVQATASNDAVLELLASVDDPDSHAALLAERQVVRAMGADCHSCIGVYVYRVGAGWCGRAMAARADGSGMVRLSVEAESAESAGVALIEYLASRQVPKLLRD